MLLVFFSVIHVPPSLTVGHAKIVPTRSQFPEISKSSKHPSATRLLILSALSSQTERESWSLIFMSNDLRRPFMTESTYFRNIFGILDKFRILEVCPFPYAKYHPSQSFPLINTPNIYILGRGDNHGHLCIPS